jgi:hypothetical protein
MAGREYINRQVGKRGTNLDWVEQVPGREEKR